MRAAMLPGDIMDEQPAVIRDLEERFGEGNVTPQNTRDDIPTAWVPGDRVLPILRYLKDQIPQPYRMLYDLTAIDERERVHRTDQPASDFTVVYHLLSYERNGDVRIKTPLRDDRLSVPSIVDLWPSASWYECEVWDMFGIAFGGIPTCGAS